jgi:PAS domain S-box-containing protein
VIIIAALAFTYVINTRSSILKERQAFLETISELKLNEFTLWNKERIGDALTFSNYEDFSSDLEFWIENQSDKKTIGFLLREINMFIKHYNYDDILITDRLGNLILSASDSSRVYRLDPQTLELVHQVVEMDTVLISDLYYCNTHKKIHQDFLVPFAHHPEFILILRIDPDKYLFPLIQHWPIPSESAELLMVRKDGDSVVFLNNLRFRSNSALTYKLPIVGGSEIPAVQAVQGKRGITEGTDYRGHKVICYIMEVPRFNWYMVTKIDKKEIYREMTKTTLMISLFSLVGVICSIFFIFWLYNLGQHNLFRELFEKEKSIAEANQLFRTTLYSIGDAVITTDRHGKIRHMNKVAEELTGYTETESFDKPLELVFNVVSEDSLENVENPVVKVLNSGRIINLANHTLLISKSGKKIPIADSGAPIIDSHDQTIGVVLVFRDQTEERRLMANLESRENLVKSIINAAPIGIGLVRDRILMDVNERVCEMIGYSRDEIIGKNCRILYQTEEEYQFVGAEKNRQIQELGVGSVETRWVAKNGNLLQILLSSAPLDVNDPDKGFTFTVVDITARKLAEARLEQEQTFLRSIIEHIPDQIYVKDRKSRFVICNTPVAKLAGCNQPSDMYGKTDLDFYPISMSQKYFDDEQRLMDTGEAIINIEEQVVNQNDGKIMWNLTTKVPIYGAGGQVTGLIGINRDITDRHELMEQLVVAKEHAEEVAKLKTRLLANLSHEIRTPLNGILGFAELLSDSPGSEMVYKWSDIIYNSGQRLLNTLNGILDLSLLESQQTQVILIPVNLNKIVENVSSLFVPLAYKKGLDLSWKVPDTIIEILGQPGYIEKILNNLIHNAIKFTSSGFVRIDLNILKDQEGTWAAVSVSDSGPGIKEEDRGQIFLEFRQAGSSKSKVHEGTGLGLHISKGLAEFMHGKILLNSKVGEGSEFTLMIPVHNS